MGNASKVGVKRMADREKVIKGLEICIPLDEGENCPTECPYYRDNCVGYSQLMREALGLLKEQDKQFVEAFNTIKDAYKMPVSREEILRNYLLRNACCCE